MPSAAPLFTPPREPGPAFFLLPSPFGVSAPLGAGVEGASDALSAGVPFCCESPLAVAGEASVSALTTDSSWAGTGEAKRASDAGATLSMTIFFGCSLAFLSAFEFGVDMVTVWVMVDIVLAHVAIGEVS